MNVGQLGFQLLALERLGHGFDLRVPRAADHFECRRMDAFQQKELDFAFVEGSLAHI